MSTTVDQGRVTSSWSRDESKSQAICDQSQQEARSVGRVLDGSGDQAIVSLDSRRLKVIRDATEA